MSNRHEQGLRWFKFVVLLVAMLALMKAVFALGSSNPGNKLAQALLLLVSGTVLLGGTAYLMGVLIGPTRLPRDQKDTPNASGVTPISLTANLRAPSQPTTTAANSGKGQLTSDDVTNKARDELERPPTKLSYRDEVSRKGLAQAYQELAEDTVDKGLWAAALVDSDGDPQKARSIYLRERGAEVREEILSARASANEREVAKLNRAALQHEAATWSAFVSGEPVLGSSLRQLMPAIAVLGFSAGDRNRRGDNLIAYALRIGLVDVIEDLLRLGVHAPSRVAGQPVGQWSLAQHKAVQQCVQDYLWPRLISAVRVSMPIPAVVETISALLWGRQVTGAQLNAAVKAIGVRVEHKDDRWRIYPDGTDLTKEVYWRDEDGVRRIVALLLEWADRASLANVSMPIKPSSTRLPSSI